MIRKILLAVDDRKDWKKGEMLAEELGEKLSAEVVVLHVREWIFGPRGPSDEGRGRSFEVVERVTRTLRDHGVTVRPKLRSGFPTRTAQQIVEVATSENADLIVVGPHRRHGLIGSMSGDVTDRVVRLSRVPVLVAG
jgi:nucleotide-binding universal stress UspA family protein